MNYDLIIVCDVGAAASHHCWIYMHAHTHTSKHMKLQAKLVHVFLRSMLMCSSQHVVYID